MYRLCQNFKLMALSPCILQQIGRRGLAGEEKYLATGQEATNADSRFNAIHVRHDDIADDQIRLERSCAFHCCCSGIHRRSVISVQIEDFGQSVSNDLLVVNHQNSRFFTRLHSLAPSENSEAELPIIAETRRRRIPSGNLPLRCRIYPLRHWTALNLH